jgi:1,4-dihydroxy-2-naphthoate octaprenyltransferase
MKKVQSKIKAWLKAARLQFYPMAWIAYTLGALSGAAHWGKFELAPYLAGYLFLFFLELLTVFLAVLYRLVWINSSHLFFPGIPPLMQSLKPRLQLLDELKMSSRGTLPSL